MAYDDQTGQLGDVELCNMYFHGELTPANALGVLARIKGILVQEPFTVAQVQYFQERSTMEKWCEVDVYPNCKLRYMLPALRNLECGISVGIASIKTRGLGPMSDFVIPVLTEGEGLTQVDFYFHCVYIQVRYHEDFNVSGSRWEKWLPEKPYQIKISTTRA